MPRLAAAARPRGIASPLCGGGKIGAKRHRRHGHIAQKDANAARFRSKGGNTGAQCHAHPPGPIVRTNSAAVDPAEGSTNGNIFRPGDNNDLGEARCRNCLSNAPDDGRTSKVGEQLAAAKAPPCPSGKD